MPDPTVPPTPPVPLDALLARSDLGLRRIAGPEGPDIAVHWAHTSEMADPYPYLLGGELLLSAGVHIPEGAGPGYFDAYVSRIVAAGGTALGFGVAPVHDMVPGALVEACEMHGLPLVEVPPRTTFSAVARAVWQLMAQARTAELRRVTEAQQSLATAAARPDPVPSVLHQLARRLAGRAVLYGPEGTEIAGAGADQGEEARTALMKLAEVVRPPTPGHPRTPSPEDPRAPSPGHPRASSPGHRPGSGPDAPAGGSGDLHADPAARPSSASDTVAGVRLVAHALGNGEGFVLGVAAPQRDGGDHTIASVAAVLLSLLTGERHSGAGAGRSSALVRLLLGAAPGEVAPLLGGDRWRVVHGRPDGRAVPDPVAASALGAALGSSLVDVAGEVVRVLVPDGRAVERVPGWTLGVSAVAAPPDWPAADTQAARALARARATRAPLLRHGDRPALTDLVPESDADAHARALLAPIRRAPALVDTLRTWLSLHGSWDRTAVALDVHRNTVRQRIARCAALLEADLDDPDVRMELWFALRRT
ncbi:PucR family transcriptional regulator ligand-binding domain-containing protein [Streptomyces sp. NPDC085937]|uniref:PucR family transcriptional regulator ligand-binding domain-containing protein n=1 Tax=Streptomyces sp. NPDC085937 TaxID=3365742 RepID=UPI0037D315AA